MFNSKTNYSSFKSKNEYEVIGSMDVSEKCKAYADQVRPAFEYLRALIVEMAQGNGIDDLEETLKWNNPRYLTKN